MMMFHTLISELTVAVATTKETFYDGLHCKFFNLNFLFYIKINIKTVILRNRYNE